MLSRNLTKWMLATVTAVAGLTFSASTSQAHFHGGWGSSSSSSSGCWGCSSSSSSGCWGSSSSSGCWGSSSSSGGWGWHRANYSSWGSSCSSGGCWGCSSSSSSGWGSSSSSSSSSSGTVIYDNAAPSQSMPAAPANGTNPPPAPAPGEGLPGSGPHVRRHVSFARWRSDRFVER